jgi:ABC-type transporter Mla MlaB component
VLPRLTSVSAVVVTMSERIARADIPVLCERVRALLEEGDADVLVCDVGRLFEVDAVAIDALARIQLTARRSGRTVLLINACSGLRGLLTLTGLSGVIPAVRGDYLSS